MSTASARPAASITAKPATGKRGTQKRAVLGRDPRAVVVADLHRIPRHAHLHALAGQLRIMRMGRIPYRGVSAVVTLLVAVPDGDESRHVLLPVR